MKPMKGLALAMAAVGLIGLVLGAIFEPRAALAAYLGGFAYALSLSLGCLLLVILAHTIRPRWMQVYRRSAEVGAATLFVLLPAFLPVLIGAPAIYPWIKHPSHPQRWLSLPFFALRALGYFAVWIVVSEILLYFSRREDPNLSRTTARLRTFSGASIWPIVLTLTFATFDWFMSLDLSWSSSMYPVYFFSGSFLAALALLGVVRRREPTVYERHSLGKLELTFVIFWAYIAYSQFMLIWIADLPQEIGWYRERMGGAWGAIAIAVIVGQFAIPFFLLLSRSLKLRQRFLAAIGSWLLFAHWLDMVWLIVPSADPEPRGPWLHLAALFFFLGLLLLTAQWRAQERSA